MPNEHSMRSIISIYTEKSSSARDTSEVSANRSASHPASHPFQILAPKELHYLTLPNLIQVAEHFRIKTFSRSRSRRPIVFLTWQELEGRLRVVFEGSDGWKDKGRRNRCRWGGD